MSKAAVIITRVALALAACSGGSVREPPLQLAPMLGEAPVRRAPDPPSPGPAARIELTFAGDVIFGRQVEGELRHARVPEHDPLAEVTSLLASDLSLVNLETPVLGAIPTELPTDYRYRFVATPEQVAVLARGGVDAVTIANNHINDVGEAGVRETAGHLALAGLAVVGEARYLGEPQVETFLVRGWRVGVIAATTVMNHHVGGDVPQPPLVRPPQLEAALVPMVAAARRDHDLVVVVMHWGKELADQPEAWQVRAAHAFVDAGAAAVIGHHPHVLQAIERYGGGVIAYSLGNFVFPNGRDPQRLTGVLRLGFAGAGAACLDEVTLHPAVMRGGDVHHPEPAEGRTLAAIVDRIAWLSRLRPLAPTSWSLDGARIVAPPACR